VVFYGKVFQNIIVIFSLTNNIKIYTYKNYIKLYEQGGSNMTGTDLYVNKPHCAAAVRP